MADSALPFELDVPPEENEPIMSDSRARQSVSSPLDSWKTPKSPREKSLSVDKNNSEGGFVAGITSWMFGGGAAVPSADDDDDRLEPISPLGSFSVASVESKPPPREESDAPRVEIIQNLLQSKFNDIVDTTPDDGISSDDDESEDDSPVIAPSAAAPQPIVSPSTAQSSVIASARASPSSYRKAEPLPPKPSYMLNPLPSTPESLPYEDVTPTAGAVATAVDQPLPFQNFSEVVIHPTPAYIDKPSTMSQGTPGTSTELPVMGMPIETAPDASSKTNCCTKCFESEKMKRVRTFFGLEGIRILWIVAWVAMNVLVFIFTYIDWTNKTVSKYVPVAKAFGMLLNINCALILITVCRNFLSLLRDTVLENFFPFDKNIVFHKYIGRAIALFTLAHALAHYYNYRDAAMGNRFTYNQLLFGNVVGISGHLLFFVCIAIFSSSTVSVRVWNFECFWYTHHLFVFFYVLLLMHGYRFWQFGLGPILLYAFERLYRLYRARAEAPIISVNFLKDDVMEVHMQRGSFHFKAGQYLFVCCPYISAHEWHPFTISSPPEDEILTLHIKALGDWTKDLKRAVKRENADQLANVNPDVLSLLSGLPIMKIDGPFGAPSEHVFSNEIVMLMCAGIGVTPYASILRSIVYKMKNFENRSGCCTAGNCSCTCSCCTFRVKKVYFYWSCRDKGATEWFCEILRKIEIEIGRDLLELHIYITGLKDEDKARLNAFPGPCPVTGLSKKCITSRPDYEAIFDSVKAAHLGRSIGVFFCGTAMISRQLAKIAHEKSDINGTMFQYRKENF